jgi:hypothetical protein
LLGRRQGLEDGLGLGTEADVDGVGGDIGALVALPAGLVASSSPDALAAA